VVFAGKRLELLVKRQRGHINDPDAEMCRSTKRAANHRTRKKLSKRMRALVNKRGMLNIRIQGRKVEALSLSDFIVAVASLLGATDPALATLLAASPRATLDSNVQVFS